MTYSLVKVFASAHLPLSIQNHYLSSVVAAQLAPRRSVTGGPARRCVGTRPRTDGFSFPQSGPWPDSLDNRVCVAFSICSSRSNESSCLFIKYELLSHLLVFLNKQFYSWLFIQKLNISGTGEGSERRQNFHVYHKACTSFCLEKYKPFIWLHSKADRGQDNIPLDSSAMLAKHKKMLAMKLYSSVILAVLLHHLESGETKTRGQRCPILKPASQVILFWRETFQVVFCWLICSKRKFGA